MTVAPSRLLTLDGDWAYVDGGAGGTASSGGSARFVTGVPGSQREAINAVLNPRTGWENGTIDPVVTAPVPSGIPVYAATKVVTPANTAGAGTGTWAGWDVNGTKVLGSGDRVLFASVWVKDDGAPLWIALQEWHNGWAASTNTSVWTPGDGRWHLYTLQHTILGSFDRLDGVWLAVNADPNWTGTVPSRTYWVSHPLVTVGEPTAYLDGDMGEGYGWVGTPHASPSYREAWATGGTRSALIEPAATNLVPDPWCRSGYGWTVGGGLGAAVSQTYETARLPPGAPLNAGHARQQIISGTQANIAPWRKEGAALAPGRYQASAWVYHTHPTAISCRINMLGFNAGFTVTVVNAVTIVSVPPHTWVELTLPVTVPSGSVNTYLDIITYEGAPGTAMLVTGARVVMEPIRTSMIPAEDRMGNLLPGYAWTGTANQSASTRAAGTLTLPAPGISTAEISAMVRFRIPDDLTPPDSGNRVHMLWASGLWDGVNHTFACWLRVWDHGGVQLVAESYAPDTTHTTATLAVDPGAAGSWVTFYAGVKTGETIHVWTTLPGTWSVTGTHTPSTATLSAITNVGGNGSVWEASAPLGPVVWFDALLTDYQRGVIADAMAAGTLRFVQIPAWSGPSVAQQVPSRFTAVPRVYLSDVAQTIRDELILTPAIRATLSYSEDRATKREGIIDVKYPHDLRRMEDFVLVELDITDDFGVTKTMRLGHYMVIGHETSLSNTAHTGSVQLRDLSYLLHLTGFNEQHVVSAGTDLGAAARSLLLAQGVPASIIDIPDAGVVASEDIPTLPEEKVLTFLTDLLAGGGMYQPWVSAANTIRSRKERDITTATANATYRTADGAKIIPPVREPLQDIDRLYNRVVIVKKGHGDTPDIRAVATVTDESSAVHPDRLRDRLGWSKPVILNREWQESTIETQEDADALAAARLTEGASWYQTLTIDTYADRALCGHMILDLEIADPQNQDVLWDGKWWQRSWSVQVEGTVARAVRELNQTVRVW